MKLYIHRVNKVAELLNIPTKYGVEIDVRGYCDDLLLSHDPIVTGKKYDSLETYLKEYKHGGIIFNIKEAGYEDKVISLAKQYGVGDYFLLDVEFPYLYRATRKEGIRNIAVRYSEAEPIEMVAAQMENDVPLLDWVWIDTNTKLPLDESIVSRLEKFKTCLVCPERWGRPEDIESYAKKMRALNFEPTAVMTALKYAEKWNELMS